MDHLTAARIQTVRDHMRLECERDWDGVIATFAHPRYELYGAGTAFDGQAAVRAYFKQTSPRLTSRLSDGMENLRMRCGPQGCD
jgi:hypothetical protein